MSAKAVVGLSAKAVVKFSANAVLKYWTTRQQDNLEHLIIPTIRKPAKPDNFCQDPHFLSQSIYL